MKRGSGASQPGGLNVHNVGELASLIGRCTRVHSSRESNSDTARSHLRSPSTPSTPCSSQPKVIQRVSVIKELARVPKHLAVLSVVVPSFSAPLSEKLSQAANLCMDKAEVCMPALLGSLMVSDNGASTCAISQACQGLIRSWPVRRLSRLVKKSV